MRQNTLNKKINRPIRVIEDKKLFNPSKYRGFYKDLRFDPEAEIEKLRDEWNRE